jgi:hypothetical protein
MPKTIARIEVRIVIEHPADVDPEEVLHNMDYSFKNDDPALGTIAETEITDHISITRL